MSDDPKLLKELDALKFGGVNLSYSFIKDEFVRKQYITQIHAYANDLLQQVRDGRLNAHDACAEANYMRNEFVKTARSKTSLIGLRLAENQKNILPSLFDLQEKKATKQFSLPFAKLDQTQKNRVWLEIIESSGKDNVKVTNNVEIRSNFGKGLLLFSGAISLHNIAVAKNKWQQSIHEGVGFVSGAIGGAIGGGTVGFCGGGPIGCGIGSFVGGVLGAIGAEKLQEYFVPAVISELRKTEFFSKIPKNHVNQSKIKTARYLDFSFPDLPKHTRTLRTNFPLLAFTEESLSQRVVQPVNNYFKDHQDSGKKQQVENLISTVRGALSKKQDVTSETMHGWSKLMLDEIVPVLNGVVTSWVSKEKNITGFEKEESIVKCCQELTELETKGRSKQEIMSKVRELQDKKTRITLQRQQFDAKMQNAEYALEGLSLLASWTKSYELQKAVVIGSSVIGISRTIAAFSGMGTLAGSITPIGGALAIASCLGNIMGVFSGGDDGATEAILEAMRQISQQINQLRTEMHERFDEVMRGLDFLAKQQFEIFCSLKMGVGYITEKLEIMHQDNQKLHQRELSYLETIAGNMEKMVLAAQIKDKSDKGKALMTELTQKRKLFELDRGKYGEFWAALSTYITESGIGARASEFTGSSCKGLDNPSALIQHINNFDVDFHLGTLASIYQQLKMQNKNYSPEMVNSYLGKILQDNQHFQLAPCLNMADLVLSRYKNQEKLFGLEGVIHLFLSIGRNHDGNEENLREILIIPLCLQAKWQLIIVNKLTQRVDIFSSPAQSELRKRITAIIQQSVPPEFKCYANDFDLHISPIHYGPIIVAIVQRLSMHELYDDIMLETIDEKLVALGQAQTQSFDKEQKLTTTQQKVLLDSINPAFSEVFIVHLLVSYYHMYPEVGAESLVDFTIDALEVNSIKSALFSLEQPYHLYQACCDADLFRSLFKCYQDAIHALQGELVKHRTQHEETLSKALNIEAKKRLVEVFTNKELMDNFEKKIEVKIYGNWFQLMRRDKLSPWGSFEGKIWYYITKEQPGYGIPSHPCPLLSSIQSCFLSAESAAKNFIGKQEEQIKAVKKAFVTNSKDGAINCCLKNNVNLYNRGVYLYEIVPYVIIPTQEQSINPILPNFVLVPDIIPSEVLQAQALGVGHLELRYSIDVTNNRFILMLCFVIKDSGIDPCFAKYAIEYKNNNATISFYSGQEAIWWFWVGGDCPQQEHFIKEVIYMGEYMTARIFSDEKLQLGRQEIHITNRKGAGYTPLSSPAYTKTLNITNEAKTTHPLFVEINRRVDNKYRELRQALNEEISNTLSNEKSALGQAVLKFEQSYKILRLFLEFIFPNSMHNQNSLLLSLLHNDSVIYNRQKLLAYLGGDKSIFVADNFISDASILAAQLLCLFLLPSQVHSHTSRLDELQGNLVQAYDYFAPYQGGVPGDKPSVQQQNQMLQLKNMLLTKLDEANSRLMDRLEALDLLPDEQRSKELKSVKDTRECFNKFKGEFNVVEQEFNNGIIPFNKAQEKLRTSKTLSLMASELQKDLFNTLVPIQATPSIKSKQNFTSSITTKSQSFFSNEFMTRSNSFVSSEPSGSKKTSRKSTAGDGDCAFHALLGELEDNQYKCKDLMAKRKRVADAIRSGKKGDKIFPLIVSGISHIIDYGNRDFIQEHFDMIKDNESHFKAIQTNYRNWDAKKVGAVQLCKNELEECLRKHSDILEFIDAQYLRLKQVSGKEANLQESLWNKYDYVKNEEKDGELLKKIQAIPELSEKSIKHKLEVDRAFPWEDEVQKNSGVLDEYAKRIEQVGNCLLPHEIGIIAYVFDKCAKVYTTDPGTDKMVGLESYNDNGNNEKIEVSFDGFGHFERVENGTHLFHNL